MLQFGKIAIIGAGNVSYTLCKLLKDKDIEPFCVFVRNDSEAAKMRADLNVETVSDYEKVMLSDLAIIAVNDDAISEVASHLVDYKGLAVHTSGTRPSETLSEIERYGVFYPLQTMSKGREIAFDDVPILIYANMPDDLIRLRGFSAALSSKVEYCDDEQRKAVHLAAVYFSNFTDVMLEIGAKILKDNGLDLSMIRHLVKETMQKAFEMSPEKALTGPARRGDMETIENHMKMLEKYPEEQDIYKLLTNFILEKYHENEKL